MLTNLTANLPIVFCMLLGAAMLITEVFLPGFGLPGIGGVLLIGAGAVIAGMHYGMATALCILLAVIALLAVAISWVLRSVTKKNGLHAQLFLQEKEELHAGEDMQVLVGRMGCAMSVLRPAGVGDFDGVRLNVVTEGSFIERGAAIKIVGVDGSKIVVRETVNE